MSRWFAVDGADLTLARAAVLSKLPPFNPAAKCPKCVHDTVTVAWNEEKKPQRVPWDQDRFYFCPEQLTRRCARCGYDWSERCVGGGAR